MVTRNSLDRVTRISSEWVTRNSSDLVRSSEWVTRNFWEKLSTFSPDFPVNFRGFPEKIPGNFRGFSAKLLLWRDLFCANTVKLYTSWNIAIRILFGLPRQTDRYFIELISEQIHLKTMLCSRFVAFCKGIESLEQNQIFKPKYL